MANGKIIYPSGAAVQTTYTFVKNYDYGHNVGYLETDDNARALDGTLNSYAGARKKTYDLSFTRALKAQLDYFQTLWTYQCEIDLYLDGTNKDATVRMTVPPAGKSETAFVSGAPTYSFEVRFEEV
jgi:hypothetical protein